MSVRSTELHGLGPRRRAAGGGPQPRKGARSVVVGRPTVGADPPWRTGWVPGERGGAGHARCLPSPSSVPAPCVCVARARRHATGGLGMAREDQVGKPPKRCRAVASDSGHDTTRHDTTRHTGSSSRAWRRRDEERRGGGRGDGTEGGGGGEGSPPHTGGSGGRARQGQGPEPAHRQQGWQQQLVVVRRASFVVRVSCVARSCSEGGASLAWPTVCVCGTEGRPRPRGRRRRRRRRRWLSLLWANETLERASEWLCASWGHGAEGGDGGDDERGRGEHREREGRGAKAQGT